MKKAAKTLLKIVLWTLAIVLIIVLTLPLWFGPTAKVVANAIVPGKVGADFHLGHIYLNPYTARLELGDVQLANPQGYSEKDAFTLGEFEFDAETLSLATDVIHINEIRVKDLFLSIVRGGENKVDNFKQIQYNVAGGKEQYDAAQQQAEIEEAEAKSKEEALKNAEAQPQDGGAAEEKPAKKVIIDHLLISGIRVQYGVLPIVIPFDLELHDIGRKSGGATLMEAWDEILAAVMKAAGAIGDQIKSLGGLAGDAAGQATKAVGDAAGQATKAVGDAAGAAGEAAGKALNSLKKLW